MNTTINSDTAGEISTNTMTTNSLSLFERAGKAIKEFATISEIMRLFGAMGVLASMFVFLTQNWAADTDIELFLLMLTQTSLLVVAGFIMFKLLKENKSAIMMLIISLVYASEIIAAVMHSGWIGLTISGVSIIILASLPDRHGAMMKMKFLQKKLDFSEV